MLLVLNIIVLFADYITCVYYHILQIIVFYVNLVITERQDAVYILNCIDTRFFRISKC